MNDLKNNKRKNSQSEKIPSRSKENNDKMLILSIGSLLLGFITLLFGSTFAFIVLCVENFINYSKSTKRKSCSLGD